ncbi:ParB-like partition protein [Escherichia phage vB_EcoM_ECOO78]|uniref:Transcriptional regulator n=1 Tax=Escherichia phage vB_EcoM_ECOO78 TaxID=1970797 RepID=A0A1W6JT62_9CAUD|nr:ParB-like partition protein [Escherichia phage vB_EcoM_ECOO78]ARM70436.1 transcriptional regulator [Escherichia phage vB_EcoM_ECOO78]
MATIGQLYKSKQTAATPRKVFWVPLAELYVEDGYNIRDVDQAHVEEFRDAYLAGEYVPPLTVEVTQQGIKVIDGHHRFAGAKMAAETGLELRLEVNDITGTSEADKIALMVTSSQGKPLEPLERAKAYARLKAQGWTNDEIAKKVKRSPSDVANMLALAECPEPIKDMVRGGQMSYVTATELTRQHGTEAEAVAAQALEEAKAAGKDKVTKKFTEPKAPKAPKSKTEAIQPPFGKDKLTRLADLAVQIELVHSDDRLEDAEPDESMTLRAPAGVVREFMALVADYVGGVNDDK